MTRPGPSEPENLPPSWAGMAPMNAVHHQSTGYSDRYWRAELLAAKRRSGQRWGIPAAAAVLALNLAGFLALPWLIDTDSSPAYVLAIMLPSVLAASLAFVITARRGNGPVVDFGLPTSLSEWGVQVRSGIAWGAAALAGGLLLALLVLARTDLESGSPLGNLVAIPTPWKVALVAWIWIGAPFCEEVMFRGMLWGALERRAAPMRMSWLGNRWVVLVVTAVVFALWHREGWRFLVLVWGGFAIGIARMRTGSVVASTTAHSVNNTLPALAILSLAE
ncbi:CAAX protease family protein [Rhodococcus sp. 1163]|uniref:CPBP family intramembrane glutamic endopeptidase n=1 Tax=unclassified Rhodococcus (in: high G+C Gram-positive bacteria) TaxID=192944 RepID=UPI000A060A0A|nr:CPBP family intramembrane glutamic endopeptidase [Rhodococcus sp. 1163]ORI11975.1 CAAX protease family protein [Rhodococcus sp. 1163]